MVRDDRENLDLSTFVSKTLVEIVQGVKEAQKDIENMDINAEVCPTGLRFEKGRSPAPFKPGRGFVQEVEFDVAITVSRRQSTDGSGKASLNVGVPALSWLPGAGLEGDVAVGHEREREKVSRVRFRVPVLLPSEVYLWDQEQGELTHRKANTTNIR